MLIFTSQAWNLAFSFHQSLMTIPAGAARGRDGLPAGPVAAVHAPRAAVRRHLPDRQQHDELGRRLVRAHRVRAVPDRRQGFRLPGLGSYLQVAANAGDLRATILGLATLVIVIVLLDQLLLAATRRLVRSVQVRAVECR